MVKVRQKVKLFLRTGVDVNLRSTWRRGKSVTMPGFATLTVERVAYSLQPLCRSSCTTETHGRIITSVTMSLKPAAICWSKWQVTTWKMTEGRRTIWLTNLQNKTMDGFPTNCKNAVSYARWRCWRYSPVGHGFDSWWCHWNFYWTQSFRPYYSPGVNSAYNRNE
jgi:hypothetical protein